MSFISLHLPNNHVGVENFVLIPGPDKKVLPVGAMGISIAGGRAEGDISIHPNSQCSSVYPPTFYVRLGMQEFPALNGRTGLSEAMERHCQTTKVGESSSRACRDAEPFLPLHSECRVCWGLCGTTAPPSGFSFAQSFARWPNCIPEFWGSQACFPLPRDAQGCCTQLHPCQ